MELSRRDQACGYHEFIFIESYALGNMALTQNHVWVVLEKLAQHVFIALVHGMGIFF